MGFRHCITDALSMSYLSQNMTTSVHPSGRLRYSTVHIANIQSPDALGRSAACDSDSVGPLELVENM